MNCSQNIYPYFKDSIAQTHMFSDLKNIFQEFECKINREFVNNKLKRRTDYGKNPLTAEEKLVIEDKGTEPPFTGKYHDHFADGFHHCKRCGAPI